MHRELGHRRRPIVIRGSRRAVIDGKPGDDGTGTQYGLYIAGADHVKVKGLTVRNVSKGIVADRANHLELLRVGSGGPGRKASTCAPSRATG